jgi:hypothetical protein
VVIKIASIGGQCGDTNDRDPHHHADDDPGDDDHDDKTLFSLACPIFLPIAL